MLRLRGRRGLHQPENQDGSTVPLLSAAAELFAMLVAAYGRSLLVAPAYDRSKPEIDWQAEEVADFRYRWSQGVKGVRQGWNVDRGPPSNRSPVLLKNLSTPKCGSH